MKLARCRQSMKINQFLFLLIFYRHATATHPMLHLANLSDSILKSCGFKSGVDEEHNFTRINILPEISMSY